MARRAKRIAEIVSARSALLGEFPAERATRAPHCRREAPTDPRFNAASRHRSPRQFPGLSHRIAQTPQQQYFETAMRFRHGPTAPARAHRSCLVARAWSPSRRPDNSAANQANLTQITRIKKRIAQKASIASTYQPTPALLCAKRIQSCFLCNPFLNPCNLCYYLATDTLQPKPPTHPPKAQAQR